METGVFKIVVLIFSIVVHECAHGWMALRCGDPTAKFLGRLTLNPIPHLDPIGSVILPLFLFLSGSSFLIGWAKPVPVNPRNFNNPGFDNVKVSGIGPLSNILLAFAFTFLAIISRNILHNNMLYLLCGFGIQINLILALFNILPLSPLDGSHILEYYIPSDIKTIYNRIQVAGPIILLILIITGLLWTILWPPYYYLFDKFLGIIEVFT